jgi:TolB-like protein
VAHSGSRWLKSQIRIEGDHKIYTRKGNLSGDPSQDYFADGITENLTTELSRIKDSFVIARDTFLARRPRRSRLL